jgi:hypothetical protein
MLLSANGTRFVSYDSYLSQIRSFWLLERALDGDMPMKTKAVAVLLSLALLVPMACSTDDATNSAPYTTSAASLSFPTPLALSSTCIWGGQFLSGSVYIESNRYRADMEVRVTKGRGDLDVTEVTQSYMTGGCGDWHIAEYRFRADFSISIVDYGEDFSITCNIRSRGGKLCD